MIRSTFFSPNRTKCRFAAGSEEALAFPQSTQTHSRDRRRGGNKGRDGNKKGEGKREKREGERGGKEGIEGKLRSHKSFKKAAPIAALPAQTTPNLDRGGGAQRTEEPDGQ